MHLLAAAWTLLLMAGCGTLAPSVIDPAKCLPPLVLQLQPGDEVEIKFFGAPELDSVQFIRRDGRIALRLVGDVVAAGRTPEELQATLRSAYANQLQIKDVSIVLKTPPPVLVSGAVTTPGRVPLTRPLTVLDAIMESGGFNIREAEIRSVVLIRHEQGKRQGYVFDFTKALEGEGEERPFYLQPFDIVFVPRTRIVKINQWVDQHINKMLPDLGVGYNSTTGATVYR